MEYYFDIEKQKALKTALDGWMGTPYRHWAGVKGEGCDCIHFIVRIFEELGLGQIKIPRYNRDWHIHNNEELLLEGLREQFKPDFKMQEFPITTEPINGDVVLYRFGRVASHSAIYYDDHVYQSINGSGVGCRHWLDKQWYKRRFMIMRLMICP